jgi:NADH-quinone oxidoreductase subunit C
MSSEELRTRVTEIPGAVSLLEFAPSAIADATHDHGEWTLVLDAASIRQSCEFLRAKCGYHMLSNATAVDWYPSEPRFAVVYHLLNHEHKFRLRLKCKLPGDNPVIDSVYAVWSSADWYEREIFDLFGIRFNGHPDLRRILLPEGWEGYPLRKDYPVTGYR